MQDTQAHFPSGPLYLLFALLGTFFPRHLRGSALASFKPQLRGHLLQGGLPHHTCYPSFSPTPSPTRPHSTLFFSFFGCAVQHVGS